MAEKALTTEQKRIKELEQQLKDSKGQTEKLEMKVGTLGRSQEPIANETQAVIENLMAKVDALEKSSNTQQVVVTTDGKKAKYREKDPKDLLDDSVTFTARCVMKVIPGFRDANGREVLPPYNIIVLNFAASDIRQDGREEEIINFCSYTTRWGPEIEFLRAHPEHDITFGENMNDVAGNNPRDYQFKVRAGQTVAEMSSESVLDYANQINIPNYRKKSVKDLKPLIVEHLVEEFRKEERILKDDLATKMFAKVGKFK